MRKRNGGAGRVTAFLFIGAFLIGMILVLDWIDGVKHEEAVAKEQEDAMEAEQANEELERYLDEHMQAVSLQWQTIQDYDLIVRQQFDVEWVGDNNMGQHLEEFRVELENMQDIIDDTIFWVYRAADDEELKRIYRQYTRAIEVFENVMIYMPDAAKDINLKHIGIIDGYEQVGIDDFNYMYEQFHGVPGPLKKRAVNVGIDTEILH